MHHPFKLLKINALDINTWAADLTHRRLLKVKAEQRTRPVQFLQSGTEPVDTGHIAGIAEQYRRLTVYGVVLDHPAGAGRLEALLQNAVQNRLFAWITEQPEDDLAAAVAGQVTERLKLTAQNKAAVMRIIAVLFDLSFGSVWGLCV